MGRGNSTARDVMQAVVIVDADGADADMASPWGSGKAWTRTMTGLVVGPRWILVGGWGLRGQKHVGVTKQGTTAKSPARVRLLDVDAGPRPPDRRRPALGRGYGLRPSQGTRRSPGRSVCFTRRPKALASNRSRLP